MGAAMRGSRLAPLAALALILLPAAQAYNPYNDVHHRLVADWGYTTSRYDHGVFGNPDPCLRHVEDWTEDWNGNQDRDHELGLGTVTLGVWHLIAFTSRTTLVPGTTADCSGGAYYHQYSIWPGFRFTYEASPLEAAQAIVLDFGAPLLEQWALDHGTPVEADCWASAFEGTVQPVEGAGASGRCAFVAVVDPATLRVDFDLSYNTYVHPKQVIADDPLDLDQEIHVRIHTTGSDDSFLRLVIEP